MSSSRLVLAALLASPALAQDVPYAPIAVEHGPIAPLTPRIFELRTPYAGASVITLLSAGAGPVFPADTTLPALDVAPGARVLAALTDASGRVRIVLPPQASIGGPSRLRVQSLVLAPDGAWRASAAATVRRAPASASSVVLAVSASSPLPASAASLAVSQLVPLDVDRDGDRDLLAIDDTSVSVWIDHGAAGFVDESAARLPLAFPHPACLASADVDGDGDLDVFVGGVLDASAVLWPDTLWLNDGAGAFAPASAFPSGDGSTASAEFGDVDGDGDADLALASGGTGHLALPGRCRLLRNVQGAFVEDPSFTALAWNDGVAPAPALRFGDVDQDGDLDLFVARADGNALSGGHGERNRLLINDGAGAFTDETAARFAQLFEDDTSDARFVDLDLDGDLDLVALNFLTHVTAAQSGDVWMNQGGAQGGVAGTFVEDATSPFEALGPGTQVRLALHPADADSDGDVDLLVLIHDLPPGSHHVLLVNQGGAQQGALGRLAIDPTFDPGSFIASGAAWIDRDRDGDLELAIGSAGTLTGPPSLNSGVVWLENHTP